MPPPIKHTPHNNLDTRCIINDYILCNLNLWFAKQWSNLVDLEVQPRTSPTSTFVFYFPYYLSQKHKYILDLPFDYCCNHWLMVINTCTCTCASFKFRSDLSCTIVVQWLLTANTLMLSKSKKLQPLLFFWIINLW